MIVGTQYRCDNEKRRDAVRASTTINGIDYLEVIDTWAETHPDSPRQQTLLVHLFKTPVGLTADNVRVDGGVRVTDIRVVWAYPYKTIPAGTLKADEDALIAGLADHDQILVVRTGVFDDGVIREDLTGDYSLYRLSLVASPLNDIPPANFDVKLSAIDFSFKVECPTQFDCLPVTNCPPVVVDEPEIDYLSKDFNSFQRLMLDRLSVIMPEWTERNPADIGVVLVELMAYAADHLSYYQDAVATEAYLGTARRRVSMRRHARLLDYPMHDGTNARAFVAIKWAGLKGTTLPMDRTQFLTRAPSLPVVIGSEDAAVAQEALGSTFFEPLHDLSLDPGFNQIVFYTWGDDQCCLPKGATRATLDNTGGVLNGLKADDPKAPTYLIFTEVLSTGTVLPEDADPTHRHVVRVTKVTQSTDPLFVEGSGPQVQRVTEIEWSSEDALPFPLCLWYLKPTSDHSGRVTLLPAARGPVIIRVETIDTNGRALSVLWSNDGGVSYQSYTPTQNVALPPSATQLDTPSGITATFTGGFLAGETFGFGPSSVALGNVVLSDHGRTVRDPSDPSGKRTENLAPVVLGQTYRPMLSQGPVTQQGNIVDDKEALRPFAISGSAAAALKWDLINVLPSISVNFAEVAGTWSPERDLLEMGPFDKRFVVETEDDGSTFLRFGDGVLGQLPDPTLDPVNHPPTTLYRVGNGTAGNVGADAIAHAVFPKPGDAVSFMNVIGVRNPIMASGGVDPESIEQVRAYAPQAFRVVQERAVNEADYASIVERHPDVLKAVATRRWTGSWYTMFISVERTGGQAVDDAFKTDLRNFLETYRLTAQDVEIEQPEFVPLKIALNVCINQEYFRADVLAALYDALSNRVLPDGTRGFFHPDNFTFGQAVYVSQIVAAVMKVPGVSWVDPTPDGSTFERFWEDTDGSALVDGAMPMSRLEIARLDNDPNFPENGTLTLNATGGL